MFIFYFSCPASEWTRNYKPGKRKEDEQSSSWSTNYWNFLVDTGQFTQIFTKGTWWPVSHKKRNSNRLVAQQFFYFFSFLRPRLSYAHHIVAAEGKVLAKKGRKRNKSNCKFTLLPSQDTDNQSITTSFISFPLDRPFVFLCVGPVKEKIKKLLTDYRSCDSLSYFLFVWPGRVSS